MGFLFWKGLEPKKVGETIVFDWLFEGSLYY